MTHRILLADDSVTIRKVVELTFSDEDFRITAVGDGAQALESARTERPDIVIADITMPGLNGYELCERLKGDTALRTVPFLLLKGAFDSFDEEKASASRVDGIIMKPFEAQEMIGKVKELIAAAAAAPPTVALAPAPPPAAPTAPTPGVSFAPAPPRPAAPPPPLRPAQPIMPSLATPPPPRPHPAAAQAAPPPAPVMPPAPPLPSRPVAFAPPPPAPIARAEVAPPLAAQVPTPVAGPDDDLWSEVSLRGNSAPIIDPVVGEDNLWGSLAETSVLDEQVAPAPMPPPAPPVAPTLPAASEIDRAEIERQVAARIDAAVRRALEPLVAGMARSLLEDIAWQVVPELAEAMIRAEIERISRRADSG